MKRILNPLHKIGVAILLFVALLILCHFFFSDTRTEDEKQLDEMVNYHRSEGRSAIVDNGFIIIKAN